LISYSLSLLSIALLSAYSSLDAIPLRLAHIATSLITIAQFRAKPANFRALY
jgi:hypothetical protein